MKGRSHRDGHHGDLEDSSLRKGGRAKRNNSRDVGWTDSVQNQNVLTNSRGREDGADGDADTRTAGPRQQPGQDGTVERVKQQKRKSRPAPCVPQPRPEDTQVKKTPLAVMRTVLQKRRGTNPEAAAPDLRPLPERSAKGPNVTAGPKRSWASIVKGTDQDDQTSLKNNKENIKGERCEGKVHQQEREEMKREKTEEEEEDTQGDQLEDKQQELVLKKKISEMETSNEDLLKTKDEYRKQIQQLRAEVKVLASRAESLEAKVHHQLQRDEQDPTRRPEWDQQRMHQLEERAAEVGQRLAASHREVQQLEDRKQDVSSKVQRSVQRWEQLVQQLNHLTEERLEVETRLQRLPEQTRELKHLCEQLVQKKQKHGLYALLKKIKKNFKKSKKKEKEEGP